MCMPRTRIKICGITRPEDAVSAAHAGADAIGLVFYDNSPRAVSIAQARRIVAMLPPFVTVVGLFVDADQNLIDEVSDQVPLGLLQFHGNETPAFCQRQRLPWIKALHVRADTNLTAEEQRYGSASGLLLDSFQDGVPGGTGQTFNWTDVPDGLKKPIILAGGLTSDNVETAILAVRPFAVDVSSGVEAGRGIKDRARILQFTSAVRKADIRAGQIQES